VRAVGSVVEQRAPEPFDVVVVTSGGDGSAAAVRTAFPDVAVVESPTQLLPGGARNAGLGATSGEFVAFVAADCEARPGWVAGLLATHRRGHPVVAAALTNAGPDRPWAWASHFDLFSARLPGRPAGLVAYPDPVAHALSFARSVLDRIGPFDDLVLVGEDTDAARRLSDDGIEIFFEPAVRTAHRGPLGTLALLRDHYARARRAGAHRARELPAIGWRGALLECGPRWWRGVRRAVGRSWRYADGERWRLLASLPWLAAARAVAVAGWYRERLRSSGAWRASSAHAPSHQHAAPSTISGNDRQYRPRSPSPHTRT
jgi:GT2 family glycosyltransferase